MAASQMLRASIASTPLRLGLLLITTAPFCHLSEGVCDLQFPAEQWKPRVAYEAAYAGKPIIGVPPVGSGFNRTLDIDGFCNNILLTSAAFKCSENNEAAGEFNAYVKDPVNAPTSAKITVDNVNCPLRGISIRRTKTGAPFEAEIRFQYDECSAQAGFPKSPVASAAVVMGLRKVPGRQSNMVPWMQEVCNVGTTTPATASLQVVSSYPVVNVGNGQCKHSGSTKTPPGVASEEACKAECKLSLQTSEALGEKDDMCTGFAFNSKASADDSCIIYTSQEVTELEADSSKDNDWECYSMKLSKQEYHKTTEPPNAIQALPELTQNLHLREVMAGAHATMTNARLTQIQPQKGDEACFDASWWFSLQDDDGNQASIPVMEAEWEAMMDMVPQLKEEAAGVPSTMIVDHLLLRTCNPNAVGWGRECVMPTPLTVCDWKQTVLAIVTGILVPIFGWAMVNLFHRTGLLQPGRDTGDGSNFPMCSRLHMIICCLAAVLSCGLFAAAISTGVSYAFGAAKCLHGHREQIVVSVATSVPSSIAMIFGLLYLYHSRSQPVADESGSSMTSPGHKLMLVATQEGQDVSQGRPVNPDIMQTGNSAMSAYKAMGHPSTVGVLPPHDQSQNSQMMSSQGGTPGVFNSSVGR